MTENNDDNHVTTAGMPRKEKRKLLKKLKRKQLRKETAIKEKETADDPEETARLLVLEKEKAERMERDRIAFEERERLFLLELEWKNELLRQQLESEEVTNGDEDESNDGEGVDWEYVEEGPAEIIWKGNEIIVKKKKVKVPKKVDNHIEKKESERPISNQLAPQCEAYNDYRSAQEVLESVAQQVPNFGTEQDKAHCPFHLKTGVCRFGASCSRAHFYPDKSCTLLFKNMYNGPGLGCNQDEGLEHFGCDFREYLERFMRVSGVLKMVHIAQGVHGSIGDEYTDEEVERSFEEFYEDVHTEFLKYGEITNFKVCKNASSHLRGNVYVHYKSLESAVRAYQSINGRYFAGKQLSCEFVNLTKWKVAICGEYIRSRLKTCSRGSACNFIHCFRNPGGDYEWADWDKPAPRYWLKEMGALFGYTDDKFTDATVSYHSKRSRSRSRDSSHRKIHSDDDDDDGHRRRSRQRPRSDFEEKISPPENNRIKRRKTDSLDKSECSSDEQKPGHKSSNNSRWERDQESTRRVRMKREHHSKADDSESRKRKKDDKSLNRQKNEYEPVHERHRSYKKNDSKKSPQVDREVSKYSLERDEDKSYNHRAKSSRASDGGKIETDEKRTHKKYKSRRPDNPTDSIDSESEGRLHRSTKKHKRVKHEAESSYNASDEGMSRKYEKEPKKDRRTRSKSKKLDTEHSQCEDINSTKDHKCNDLEMENPSPTNKSSKGSTTYKTEEACFRSLDGKAEDDLEQTFRLAALKKLEEKRKCKDSLPVESRMSNVWVDIQSHENVVGEDAEGSKELAEISPSREARTSSASVRRKRI